MKAIALRLQGATFRQIAAALGCSVGTAHEDVTAELMAVSRPDAVGSVLSARSAPTPAAAALRSSLSLRKLVRSGLWCVFLSL